MAKKKIGGKRGGYSSMFNCVKYAEYSDPNPAR